MHKKIIYLTPFAILFLLLALLAYELFYSDYKNLESPLIGKPLPPFHLETIFSEKKIFSEKDLVKGPLLLTVWATWCYSCELEHDMLMKIRDQYHVPIYSILYKDDVNKVKVWLLNKGNPFILSGNDKNGDTAMDLGVYGTPETFVINAQQKIIYRHVGMIDQTVWEKTLYPLLQKNGLSA